MFAVIFRGFFFLIIIFWYTLGVWKLIDGYFRDQVNEYMSEELKKNSHLASDISKLSAVKFNEEIPKLKQQFTVNDLPKNEIKENKQSVYVPEYAIIENNAEEEDKFCTVSQHTFEEQKCNRN